ncbi:aminotransferase class V-fold PLP-dependent enzyme [Fodinicurvata sp. EGI_FJ10296]|uniref:aminotransferase class V-fold PLP-dependent enzyme n=1 Tax=Fodinicurvata sp. EGI_FJ10296 TaxID=3231908 RepID=UPI003454B096
MSTQAEFRSLFPVFDRRIYMDIAARAPLSRPVRQAYDAWLDDWQGTGGTKDQWMAALERTRGKFARLIGAKTSEVAFTKNVSEGLNIIANAIEWRAGDNVVLCPDVEHPNNIYVWLNERRRDVEIRIVKSDHGRVRPEDYFAAIDDRTRLVAISQVSFAPGRTLDPTPIGKFCRERGIFLLVDAAQSAGVMHVDVEAMNIDALAVSSHKAILGPYGMGFLYCRQEWLQRMQPVYLARYSVLVAESDHEEVMGTFSYQLPNDGRRFEVGNYNYSAAIATEAALDMLLEAGSRTIEAHVLNLADTFTKGLEAAGLEVCSGRRDDGLCQMVTVGQWGSGGHYSSDDESLTRLFELLLENGVTLSLRRGLVRFSLHYYNNDDDIQKVLSLVKSTN